MASPNTGSRRPSGRSSGHSKSLSWQDDTESSSRGGGGRSRSTAVSRNRSTSRPKSPRATSPVSPRGSGGDILARAQLYDPKRKHKVCVQKKAKSFFSILENSNSHFLFLSKKLKIFDF